MRVLVCGGRDFTDWRMLASALEVAEPSEIIEGGAKGADGLARHWGNRNQVPVRTFSANWDDFGKAAGPIRNQQMLDVGKPELVIAFPGGRGTADMVRRAKAAGVPVREIA